MSMPLSYHASDCLATALLPTKVFSGSGAIAAMQNETIATRLARLRNAKGLSQTELASKAGLAQGAIGNIEAGTRGYGRSVFKIAKALETTPEYLLMDDQAAANLESELTKEALTVAAIFDWLTDKDDREQVRVIMTQAVLARLRPTEPLEDDPPPQVLPTSKPVPAGRAKK
jgi:transcriptional regulator with XRE-family HTH domain